MENDHSSSGENFMHYLWTMILDLVQVVVMSLAIFVVVYIFLFQPNQVRGSSMVPTFENGEYILTDKVTYRWKREPQRGDVIVFRSPENNNYDFIKRVIGIPGDVVKLQNGKVFINNKQLDEDYLPQGLATAGGAFMQENKEYVVPEGGFIAFGDNRNASSDSREWGPVPEENIVGRAWFRYWPPTRIGLITHEEMMLE